MAEVLKKPTKLFTLMLVIKDGRVLLGEKKRGFGSGKWNGFGGKVEPGETILEAAIRETQEEACITPTDINKVALIHFEFLNKEKILEVHVFRASGYTGDEKETEEMRPKWFPLESIPFDSMWPDDKLWFPLMLDGKKFKGYCYFEDEDTITKHTFEEVDGFDDEQTELQLGES